MYCLKYPDFGIFILIFPLLLISCEHEDYVNAAKYNLKNAQQQLDNIQKDNKQTSENNSWHVKHITSQGVVLFECDTDDKPEAWDGGVCFTDKDTGKRWSIQGGITDMTKN